MRARPVAAGFPADSARPGSPAAIEPIGILVGGGTMQPGPGRVVWRDYHGRSDMAVSRCPGPRTAVAHRRQPIPVRRLRTFADAQASDAPVTSRPMIVIAAEAGT
jgi:hypothetical protein